MNQIQSDGTMYSMKMSISIAIIIDVGTFLNKYWSFWHLKRWQHSSPSAANGVWALFSFSIWIILFSFEVTLHWKMYSSRSIANWICKTWEEKNIVPILNPRHIVFSALIYRKWIHWFVFSTKSPNRRSRSTSFTLSNVFDC